VIFLFNYFNATPKNKNCKQTAHFAKRNTKFGGGGKKLESESEGGQKFLPPNPLPFCPPERLDFKIRNSDFRQKMFEHQSKNTANFHKK
jgi:hypothetical protein